jgi:hypothetical protein
MVDLGRLPRLLLVLLGGLFFFEVGPVELGLFGGVAHELPPFHQQGVAGHTLGAGNEQIMLVHAQKAAVVAALAALLGLVFGHHLSGVGQVLIGQPGYLFHISTSSG